MRHRRSYLLLFLVGLAIAASPGGLLLTQRSTSAAVGDALATCSIPVGYAGTSTSIARTDTVLVYANPDAAVLHQMGSSGTCGAIAPDLPAVPGITALAYDGVRDAVWAIAGNQVYTIDLSGGGATPQFALPPALSYAGLAYDAALDNLWVAAYDGYTIRRYDLGGVEQASCATTFGVRGLAAGGDHLFGAAGMSQRIFQLDKSSCAGGANVTVVSSWSTAEWDSGLACDPMTLAPLEAIWSRGSTNNQLTAYEVPAGTCPLGGGVAPSPTDTPTPAATDTPGPAATDTPVAGATDTPVPATATATVSGPTQVSGSGGNQPGAAPTMTVTPLAASPTVVPLPPQSALEPPALPDGAGDEAGAGAAPAALPDTGRGTDRPDTLAALALTLWLSGTLTLGAAAAARRR